MNKFAPLHNFQVLLLTGLFLLPYAVAAQRQLPRQAIDPAFLNDFWQAQWIGHPTASTSDYGVFHFRRTIDLDNLPERLVVHMSADNRYQLFINGERIAEGPSRDDLDHWRYETLDIAPFLREGRNTLAAVVWNFGPHRPVFQQSYATAFLMQANDPAHFAINTGEEGWKVWKNEAYAPEVEAIRALNTFHVTGPGDRVDGSRYPWGWKMPEFDDSGWHSAHNLSRAHPAAVGTGHAWGLTPRDLPLMESYTERLSRIRRSQGIVMEEEFLQQGGSLEVPPRTKATLLLDQTFLTNAYPELVLSGGAGSRLTLTYAESLYLSKTGNEKGNRDEVEGKIMRGQQDVFLPDGGDRRTFSPLWFRTYRYLELKIETADAPLTLHDIYGRFTGYPFEERARFAADDGSLAQIWEVGWRTARLCAGETYYDCPYYEQLQYVGDTRIQALISLYVSGDDRLMRKAIDAYDHSRLYFGLTHSRYPEGRPLQLIPPYSLFWVNMVYDYWMHRDDPEFVEEKLSGVAAVLQWYEQQVDPKTGLIGESPYWNFVDWAWPWDPEAGAGGVPDLRGGSAILSLQLAYALDDAVRVFRVFGRSVEADHYQALSQNLKHKVWVQCWDRGRGLFADTPARQHFSQHANIWAILTDALPVGEQQELMARILGEEDLTQASFYFQFYLFEALQKIGWTDRYFQLLDPWRDMLGRGLTTFAENPDPTRSDCHAWSASPNYDLLAKVCGIRPGTPGFKSVLIEPNLGELDWIEGVMPHPLGPIEVRFERAGPEGISGQITLPEGLSGTLRWKEKEKLLQPGAHQVSW